MGTQCLETEPDQHQKEQHDQQQRPPGHTTAFRHGTGSATVLDGRRLLLRSCRRRWAALGYEPVIELGHGCGDLGAERSDLSEYVHEARIFERLQGVRLVLEDGTDRVEP